MSEPKQSNHRYYKGDMKPWELYVTIAVFIALSILVLSWFVR